MDVFAYYDCSLNAPETQPAWVPLWERSWRARGWNPRLITARHARRSKFYSRVDPAHREKFLPLLALNSVGGGWLSPLDVINFSFRPQRASAKVGISYRDGVIQAPQVALGYFFKAEIFVRADPIAGLRKFSSPEEALKCQF